MYSVIDGALHVIEQVHRGAAEDDGGNGALLVVLTEDGDKPRRHLLNCNDIGEAHLLRRWRTDPHHSSRVDGLAQAAQFELRHYLHCQHSKLLDVVHGDLADRAAGDDNLGA
jgi:hypothetical protein